MPICPKCETMKNRDGFKRWSKWCQDCRAEASKSYQIKRSYGLTAEQYKAMLDQRGALCPICGKENDKPHVDHCHKTGKVRGLLCGKCNTALGMMKENSKAFLRAAVYLQDALEPGFLPTFNTLEAIVDEAFSAVKPRHRQRKKRRYAEGPIPAGPHKDDWLEQAFPPAT